MLTVAVHVRYLVWISQDTQQTHYTSVTSLMTTLVTSLIMMTLTSSRRSCHLAMTSQHTQASRYHHHHRHQQSSALLPYGVTSKDLVTSSWRRQMTSQDDWVLACRCPVVAVRPICLWIRAERVLAASVRPKCRGRRHDVDHDAHCDAAGRHPTSNLVVWHRRATQDVDTLSHCRHAPTAATTAVLAPTRIIIIIIISLFASVQPAF